MDDSEITRMQFGLNKCPILAIKCIIANEQTWFKTIGIRRKKQILSFNASFRLIRQAN